MTPSQSGSSKPAKGSARKPPAKERRTEILLEDIRGTVNVIAEGHQMLVENLASLRAEMKEGFQDQNHQRELSNKALTKRIDDTATGLRQEIQEVRTEVRGLRTDIRENIQPRLDDHEARITVLEGKPAA